MVTAIVIRQESVHVVARVYGVPQRTVFDWLSLYRSGGWNALKEGQRSGRPGKVFAEQMRWVYNAVTLGNPEQFQLEFCLWTLNTLRALIQRELGITLSKSAVSRLLRHLGLTPQRPLYKSYKQDPRKAEQYLAETFPAAVAEARRRNTEIYFVDEASVRSDAHRGTTWGKAGETPVVRNSRGTLQLQRDQLLAGSSLRPQRPPNASSGHPGLTGSGLEALRTQGSPAAGPNDDQCPVPCRRAGKCTLALSLIG